MRLTPNRQACDGVDTDAFVQQKANDLQLSLTRHQHEAGAAIENEKWLSLLIHPFWSSVSWGDNCVDKTAAGPLDFLLGTQTNLLEDSVN